MRPSLREYGRGTARAVPDGHASRERGPADTEKMTEFSSFSRKYEGHMAGRSRRHSGPREFMSSFSTRSYAKRKSNPGLSCPFLKRQQTTTKTAKNF